MSESVDMTKPHATKTGWSGLDYKKREEWEWLRKHWHNRTIMYIMVVVRGFKLVEYKGYSRARWRYVCAELPDSVATNLVDRNGHIFGYRSAITSWILKVNQDGSCYIVDFRGECNMYIGACGPRSQQVIKANNRGNHWHNIIGVDRQNKPASTLSPHAMSSY